jgi:uncharacterized protein GlcG (DUF336 family)
MYMKAGFAAGAVALALMPGALSAQVQTQRDITWKLGLAIAQGAIEECANTNKYPISVAVVDRAGRIRVFISSDDPSPHNFELARRKAYTARTFRRPSMEWAQRTKEGDAAAQRQLADVIALGGGVPINVGNETIGAVGVSGFSQTGDEACAKAGIAKVADQLATN